MIFTQKRREKVCHSVHWKTVFATALCVVACSGPCLAQAVRATVLELDAENVVRYYEDTGDSSKFGTLPAITPAAIAANFQTYVLIGDIVAINGQPVRGTVSHTARWTNLTPAPKSGEAIADMIRGGLGQWAFEIQTSDGAPIGTIFLAGMHGGAPTPGSPLQVTQGNNAIIGGTGAFLGARGDFGQAVTSQTIAIRPASITEDPANRRKNGGGKIRWVFQIVPTSAPQIMVSSAGPAVFHSDFTPVTAAKPAKSGEILIVQATGLCPTRPGVNPGQPFPTDAIQMVNSPVGVTTNGAAAEVINAIGWPSLVDTYRVDFRVPDGTKAGIIAIQFTVAWITGSAVNIPTQ